MRWLKMRTSRVGRYCRSRLRNRSSALALRPGYSLLVSSTTKRTSFSRAAAQAPLLGSISWMRPNTSWAPAGWYPSAITESERTEALQSILVVAVSQRYGVFCSSRKRSTNWSISALDMGSWPAVSERAGFSLSLEQLTASRTSPARINRDESLIENRVFIG